MTTEIRGHTVSAELRVWRGVKGELQGRVAVDVLDKPNPWTAEKERPAAASAGPVVPVGVRVLVQQPTEDEFHQIGQSHKPQDVATYYAYPGMTAMQLDKLGIRGESYPAGGKVRALVTVMDKEGQTHRLQATVVAKPNGYSYSD